MNKKIKNKFLMNYILMFVISIMVGIFILILLDFANHVISKTLAKNKYTAEILMQDDYKTIDTQSVVDNGGGVQVINSDYDVVLSEGINTFTKDHLTIDEFTDFLTKSKSIGIPYSYTIKYNSNKQFWLIVTFPTSIRVDLAIVRNTKYSSVNTNRISGVIISLIIFYLLLLLLSTVIFSKITSISFINPMKKLYRNVQSLKDGDYSARVALNLKNEFGELETILNEMAQKIEEEMYLRKQSEENRKRIVLDISHDLKNPLASIMGYAEYCYNKRDLTQEEHYEYMKIIYENSLRANHLITDLFELSKLESGEYSINKTRVDISEYMREEISCFIPILDKVGFVYEFNIPEREIIVEIDIKQMKRVFQNLFENVIRYNKKGTKVTIELVQKDNYVVVIFKDNGIGIAKDIAENIFKPFIRVDDTRNSQTGGSGLGLAIIEKIIVAHNGSISIQTDINCGCTFTIKFPTI